MSNRRFQKIIYSSLIAFAGVLTLSVLFSNCSGESIPDLVSLASQTKGGGDGVGFDGKLTSYNRYVPDFVCDGKTSAYASIDFSNGAILFTQNDVNQCTLSSKRIYEADLDVSSFQNEIFGYQEGIYQKSKPEGLSGGASSIIPSELVEVWCQTTKEPSSLEVIIKYNSQTKNAQARIYYVRENEVSGVLERREVPDFSVARVAVDHKVIVKDAKINLTVDRDVNIAGGSAEFKGEVLVKLDDQTRFENLRCRLGGYFDPSIWPAKIVLQKPVSGDLVGAPSKDGFPAWYGFYSFFKDLTDGKSLTSQKEVYLFSDDSLNFKKVAFKGPQESLGIRNFKIGHDGKYVYYRADANLLKQFRLYRVDIESGETTVLDKNGILGSGALNVLDGGFHVYSDGTLVFLDSNEAVERYKALVIPGTDRRAVPVEIPGAFITGQLSMYAYSPKNRKVIYVHYGVNNATPSLSLRSLDLDSWEVTTLKTLGSNLDVSVGSSAPEFDDELSYSLRRQLADGSAYRETYIINILTHDEVKIGDDLEVLSTQIKYKDGVADNVDTLNSTRIAFLRRGEAYLMDLESSKEMKLGLSVPHRTFSRARDVFWWGSENVLKFVEMSDLDRPPGECVFSSDEKIVKLLANMKSDAVAVFYNEKLNLLKVIQANKSGDCQVVNLIPFTLERLSDFLDAKMDPSGRILAFGANLKLRAGNFRAVVSLVPLNGSPTVVASAMNENWYFSRLQLLFSSDSSRVYFIGNGNCSAFYNPLNPQAILCAERPANKSNRDSLVQSFETPSQLLKY